MYRDDWFLHQTDPTSALVRVKRLEDLSSRLRVTFQILEPIAETHMLKSISQATSSTISPDCVELNTLQSAFAETSERMIGVEIELFIVDRKTEAPRQLFQKIRGALPEEIRKHITGEHLTSQLEVVSDPCKSLRELRDHLQHILMYVEKVAARFDAKLMWSGSHPTLNYDPSMVTDNARSAHNQRRFGPLTRQLATCGVHFHIGVGRDEVIPVIDGLQAYLPLLVALTANSPIMDGRDTGRRSQRAAIWCSGFPVCGFSGPFGDWDRFNQRVSQLQSAKRIETPKDIFDFVRPTRFSTVEVRCCDTPADLDQVVAVAGLVQALVESLTRGKNVFDRDRDILRAELHEASSRGPEAKLTDVRGDLVSPQQFLTRLVYDLHPIAHELGTDLALRLAAAVLADNGSTRQLQAFQRNEPSRRLRPVEVPAVRRPAWSSAIGLATSISLLTAGALFAFSAAVAVLA